MRAHMENSVSDKPTEKKTTTKTARGRAPSKRATAGRGKATKAAARETKPRKTTRKWLGATRWERGEVPTEQRIMIDGHPAVVVQLGGKFGAGKSFLVDAADWDKVSGEYGAQWVFMSGSDKSAPLYVASGRRVPAAAASSKGGHAPVAILARLILGAEKTDLVFYRNGDSLDLRRRNLLCLDPEETANLRRFLPVARRIEAEG